MSAKKHLKELQIRFTIVAVFFVVGATVAYMYQDQLIPFLLAPIGQEKLVYLNPAGGFSFIFLVSMYAGLAVAFPIIIQQLYGFLKPALPKKAHKKSSVIIIGSLLLLIAGVAFGYYVAVPNAIHFLYGFADKYVEASLTADSYLNFVIAYTIGIGLVFQIPLLLLLAHAVRPFTPLGLMRSERWVILVAFIVAAFITPTPDPINQTIVAGPVIIVYQIGVGIILWSIFKQRRATNKTARNAVRRAHDLKQQPARRIRQSSPTPIAQPTLRTVAMLAPQANPIIATRPASQSQGDVHQAPVKQQLVRSIDGFKPIARGSVQVQPRVQAQKIERPAAPRFSMDGVTRQRATSY